MTEITDHLAEIVERVARAAQHAGRSRDERDDRRRQQATTRRRRSLTAHRAGVEHFGESYVQEALPKMAALADSPITWHFVGKLQANKTRQVAERFDWVHTVDRATNRGASERATARACGAAERADPSQPRRRSAERRSAAADVAELARAIVQLPRLKLRGLMTLPPQRGAPAHWFAELAALRARLASEGIPLDTLSMGMSADFEEAIAAGATLVRIGTAIFGSRAP